MTIPRDLMRRVRGERNDFLDLVETARADLFAYCRSLTGDPWDAEDLVQETLLRGFGRLATASLLREIENPRAYLFRIATNAWIDGRRLAGRLPEEEEPEEPAAPDAPPLGPEVRDALARIAGLLAPRERVAVLLRDVFDFTLEEAARWQDVTVGAVKAALHRGRGKLREAAARADSPPPGRRNAVGDELLDAFVEAFDARDLDRLVALFAADATADIVGILHEDGPDVIRDGSLLHTLFDGDEPLPAGDPGAEPVEIDGRRFVALFYRVEEDGTEIRALRDLVHLRRDADGRIVHLRYDYFSPEVLREAGERLGVPVRDNGHRYVVRPG